MIWRDSFLVLILDPWRLLDIRNLVTWVTAYLWPSDTKLPSAFWNWMAGGLPVLDLYMNELKHMLRAIEK